MNHFAFQKKGGKIVNSSAVFSIFIIILIKFKKTESVAMLLSDDRISLNAKGSPKWELFIRWGTWTKFHGNPFISEMLQ